MKAKRGWIRIVEAFTALILIMVVFLIFINKGVVKGDSSKDVYEIQIRIEREIQTNENLRNLIINIPFQQLPLRLENFPDEVKQKIIQETPSELVCEARICELDKICVLENYPKKEVYVENVAITANQTNYSPKQLKLFCWRK